MIARGSGVPPREWDELIAKQDGHFLQGRAWAAFCVAMGDEVHWARGDGWGWIGQMRRRRGLTNLYLPYGPAAASPLGTRCAIEDSLAFARDSGVHFVRVEPWRERDAGVPQALFGHRTDRIQPEHTWIVDLDADEETLFSALTENRRRNVRQGEKKGIELRRTTDPGEVGVFLDMLGDTAERGHFNVHPDAYYETLLRTLIPLNACSLYVAEGRGEPLCAIVAFHDDRATYYAHAAAHQERSRKLSAPGPLAWRSILDAKQEGRRRYDFWGVAPSEDANHPWAGLSKFKRGFGGRLHATAGTWDLPRSRRRYSLYRVAKRLLP